MRQRQREVLVVGEEQILDDYRSGFDAGEAEPGADVVTGSTETERPQEAEDRIVAALERRLAKSADALEQRLCEARAGAVDAASERAATAARTELDEGLERLARELRGEAQTAREELVAESAQSRQSIERDVEARIGGATAAAVAELERRTRAHLGRRLGDAGSEAEARVAKRVEAEVGRARQELAAAIEAQAEREREALAEAAAAARGELAQEVERVLAEPVPSKAAGDGPASHPDREAVPGAGVLEGAWRRYGTIASLLALGLAALAIGVARPDDQGPTSTAAVPQGPVRERADRPHERRAARDAAGPRPSKRGGSDPPRAEPTAGVALPEPTPAPPNDSQPSPATPASPPPAEPERSAPASVTDVRREFGP